MQFSKRDNFYQVSWISGPRHNLLALALSENQDSKTTIESLPPIGECQHNKLNEELIIANVLEGIKSVNQKLNTKFQVSKIQYVENDTGPEQIFNYLTQEIVEHLVKGESFVEKG
jgi:hypothetical protein